MALFGAIMVRDQVQANLDLVTRSISRAVDTRVSMGWEVNDETLSRWVDSGDIGLFISVELPTEFSQDSDRIITAGIPIDGETFDMRQVSGTGAVVTVSVAASDIFWRSATVVILVVVVSIVALTVAAFFARWQAKRISDPLVYLAATAGVIGSGQVNPQESRKSGIEEIDLVAQELVRSGERVSSRIAAERAFASNASHQLRTPLAALSLRLEEIELLSADPAVRAEAHASLEQVERLTGVVDDLLKTARRGDTGSTEPVRVDDIFIQQFTEWGPSFSKVNRELEFEPTSAQVLATPGALAQVISTLVENSLKYGDGTTTVRVRDRNNGDNSVVIEVADEGQGVSDELAPTIFERHVTSGKGTGIGLEVARTLITADGGRLELAQRRPAVFAIFLTAVPEKLDPDKVLPPGSMVVMGRRGRRRRG